MNKMVLLGFLLLLSTVSNAGMYRWVDDSGKVHYSDKMPVSVSKKVHSELTGDGIFKKSVDPQAEKKFASQKQLDQELLALERKSQEESRLKKQRDIAEKNKYDKFLLSTYDDKSELIRFFKNKIKLLKGNSSFLKAQSIVLLKKVNKLEKRKVKVSDKRTLNSINKKIVRIENSIKQYKTALNDNTQELLILSNNYQKDYKRFTELTK